MLRAIIKIPGLRHEPEGLRILPDVMCSCPESVQARNFPEIFVFFYQHRVFKFNSMHPYLATFVDQFHGLVGGSFGRVRQPQPVTNTDKKEGGTPTDWLKEASLSSLHQHYCLLICRFL